MKERKLEYRVGVEINGSVVDFVLDTGSEVTIVSEKTAKNLDIKVSEPSRVLMGVNNSELEVVGESKLLLTNKRIAVTALVSVVKNVKRNLLGIAEIRNLNLLAIVNSIEKEKRDFDPYKTFPQIFEGLGTMPGVFKIELRENTEPYRLCTPRSIPAGLREKAKQEINSMLALDVIEPIEKPTEWCSGLTIAPKTNGAIRMCVDLTRLNKGVKRELYPLPKISDMLSQLSQGRMFSKLDANSGFWQVVLDPDSRLLTTFLTPWGRFCFKRMPFGITSAPEYFQRTMEHILVGLEGVVCMMDDILVFGSNPDEHWQRLDAVLKRISEAKMTLKREKCEFGKTFVKFLGHVVSSEGVKVDPEKVKSICEMMPPTNKTEARRFLGMVNYLNKFSANLAVFCSPIHSVAGAKSEWFWGPDQQMAFESIKLELSKTPVLCAYEVSRPHRVSADASKDALGAVLLQCNGHDNWQPAEYASQKLSRSSLLERGLWS